MFPITINGKNYTKKDEIQKKILNICEDHHHNDRAKMFCLILYDVNDGNLCKVIDDEHYWRSLNSISGSNMTVIYLPTWYSDRTIEQYNNEIEKIFDIENRNGKTLIIAFQTNERKEIIGYFKYFINSTRSEDIFLEIKGFFEYISDSLNDTKDENKHNYQELFELAKVNMTTYRAKGVIKKTVKIPLTILSIVSAIKTFVP